MSNNNISSRNTTKINDGINQIDEPLIEQSLSDDKTINPIVNIKGILKKPETDINEMIQNGMGVEDIKNMIDTNTFSGLEAKLRFVTWKKV